MSSKLLSCAIVTAGLLLGGCANLVVGRPIDQGKVAGITPGRTTRQQVIAELGPPLHTVPGSDGDIFVYRYLDGSGAAQELTVSFAGDTVSCLSHE